MNLSPQPELKRGLNLLLVTLYGLGVTVGAGIYVLVGATAAQAGVHAPLAFLLAAIVVAFTGFSYCELATRFPVSAGEAAYVLHGLGSGRLALLVGLLVAASGIVSSAAIAVGAAGYLGQVIPIPNPVLIAGTILILGAVAAWGIVESVALAALFTLVELLGLVLVLIFGVVNHPEIFGELAQLVPPLEFSTWSGISAAGLLAFFAFVGFESIANVAEEVRDPQRNLPRAILLTLVIATTLYVLVVAVMVLAIPLEDLTRSSAPLALIFEGTGPLTQTLFLSIACVATLNGILIQMIMAARVIYGLARQGNLPAPLARVHAKRRTPLIATALVVGLVLALAHFFPITQLAAATSQIILTVFVFVNLSLIRAKHRDGKAPQQPSSFADTAPSFQVPGWVPVLGLISAGALLGSSFF